MSVNINVDRNDIKKKKEKNTVEVKNRINIGILLTQDLAVVTDSNLPHCLSPLPATLANQILTWI